MESGYVYGGLRVEDLRREEHPSRLRNPLIAQTFYYAGLVERWGTGTTRMLTACRQQGLPDPDFAEEGGGFKVVFLQDPYTPERLRALGLLDRQIRAVIYAREKGGITNREYRELVGVKERTATEDLRKLVTMGILQKSGITGRAMRYIIRKAQNPH